MNDNISVIIPTYNESKRISARAFVRFSAKKKIIRVPVNELKDIFLSILRENNKNSEILKKINCLNTTDWQGLYELIRENTLLPIFYKRLLSLNLKNIPCEFLSKLKNLYLLNLKRNIILEQEILRLISYLRKRGIPVMPLKGPLLARYLYNDLDLRQTSCDIDLLIKKESINDAEYLLKNLGYNSSDEDNYEFIRSIKLKYARQIHFNKKLKGQAGLALDLHWDIRGFFVDTHLEDFWQDSKEVDMDGCKILVPSNENLLLYLAILSLSTFEFVELKYLYDIHMLIFKLKSELDWQRLLVMVKNSNLKSSLFFALRLSKNFFHTDIPESFLSQLNSNFTKEFLLKIWINPQNILYRRHSLAYSYTWRYFVSSYLYSRNIWDCMRIIYRKIFLPMNEVMGMYDRLEDKVSYLVYFKRLLKPFTKIPQTFYKNT